MTTLAESNYGVVLQRVATPIAEVISIGMPELKQDAVEVTNHDSDYREYISGGLFEAGEFNVGINYNVACSGVFNDLISGSPVAYKIVFANAAASELAFTAIVTGVKFVEADAKSPDALALDVTFRPTGSFSFTD